MYRARMFSFALLVCLALGCVLGLSAQQQRRFATGFILQGRVMDARTDMEIPGAIVVLEGRDTRLQTVADRRGYFRFINLAPDFYTVEVRREGYHPAQERFDLISDGIPDAVIRLQPDTEFVTKPAKPTVSARAALIPEEARKAFAQGVEELHDKERPEKSIDHLRRALDLYADFDEAYVQLGIAYSLLKREREAEEILHRGIEVYPKNARAYAFLGKLHAQQGKKDAAVADLQKAVELDPLLWFAHLDLARILRKQGKAELSYQHASRAHELYQDSSEVHLAFYNACLGLQDYAAALTELDEFVKLYPDSETARKMRALRDQLAQAAGQP